MRIDFRRVFSDFAVGYATTAVVLTAQEVMKEVAIKVVEMVSGVPTGIVTKMGGIYLGYFISSISMAIARFPVEEYQAVKGGNITALLCGSYGVSNIPLVSVIGGIVGGVFGTCPPEEAMRREAGPD